MLALNGPFIRFLVWFDLIGLIVVALAYPAVAWIDWLGRSRATNAKVPGVWRSVPIAALWSTLGVLVGIVVAVINVQVLYYSVEISPILYECSVITFLIYEGVRIVGGLRRLAHNSPRA